MTAQQLRNSILQQAIQGRLVPQDPNDEPASVLLEKIRVEKEQLVKEGKLKFSKPEKKASMVNPVSDFELPSTWKWCTLFDLCRVYGRIGFRGYTKSDLVSSKEDGAITLSPSNMVDGHMDYNACTYISQEKYEESPEIMIFDGDVLIVKTGSSYGKTVLVSDLPWKATINPQIAVIKDILIDVEYFVYVLQSPYARGKYEDFVLGTSIPTFSQENLLGMSFPLPPLAEQRRIVAKIEELMPLVEKYGKAQSELDNLNASLPSRLRQSILQEAIQGKLVEQDASEGSAKDLFSQIQEAKKGLVEKGLLRKKDLIVSPVIDDEVYFTVPSSWDFYHLEDLVAILDGMRRPVSKEARESGVYPYYGANGILDYVKEYIFDGEYILVGEDGSVITKTGNPVVNKAKGKIWVNNHAHIMQECGDLGYYDYLFYALQAIDIRQYIHGFMPKYSQGDLRKTLIPLPPLAEQRRIVAKIEELFAEIDKLK